MIRSLRARVTLGLAAVIAVGALAAGVAGSSLARLGGAVDTILRENYRSVVASREMAEALARMDAAAMFYAAGRDDLAAPMLAAHRADFARALRVEQGNITLPGEREAAADVAAQHADYLRVVDALRLAPQGDRNAAYFAEALPRFTRLRAAVDRVRAMNQRQMERADRDARDLARRALGWTVGATVAALALALWLAWRIPAAALRPLDALGRAVRAVGEGRLDVTLDDPGVRELEPLATAFRATVAQLREFRASAEGELAAARALADATVRCLDDAVAVLDADGGVALVNAAAERAFGLRRGDAEALRRNEIEVPSALARVRDEVLRGGEAVAPRSLADAVRRGDRWYLLRAAPMGGRALVVAQDVTRLRRIDALKSEMVATVSHEFKTPLTSLRMATHLLLEPATGPLTEAQREVLSTARDETERLRALVDDLLDLVRIETEAGALRRVEVSPRWLVERAAEAHRALAREKGVALEVVAGAELAPVAVDPEKLGIVLANLASNAIRHTRAGGAVALAAEEGAGAVRFVVRDTGEGVDAAELARLVGPREGRRIAPGEGRHGLGLTIAQEIVLQHGGELLARSAVGVGTEFEVTIPRDAR